VRAVYQREYAGKTAVLDVEITDNAETMAEELAGKDMETFEVTITGVSGNRVELELKSK